MWLLVPQKDGAVQCLQTSGVVPALTLTGQKILGESLNLSQLQFLN